MVLAENHCCLCVGRYRCG